MCHYACASCLCIAANTSEQTSVQSTADSDTGVSQEPIDGMIETIHGDVSQPTSSENNGEFE